MPFATVQLAHCFLPSVFLVRPLDCLCKALKKQVAVAYLKFHSPFIFFLLLFVPTVLMVWMQKCRHLNLILWKI